MAQTQPDLLQRPLYIFDLPEEILYSLTLKSGLQPAGDLTPAGTEPAPERSELEEKQSLLPTKATSCSLCSLNFNGLQEQRNHVKSDLHKYNLKQKLKGAKPVDEAEFEKLIGELDESISGSESESGSEEDEIDAKDSTLTALLKKQARISHAEDDPYKKSSKIGPGKPPLLWLSSPSLPDNVSLGAYRVLFTPEEQEDLVGAIRRKQFDPIPDPRIPKGGQPPTAAVVISAKNPAYFLCMIGGGHFAAMIVSLAPKLVKKQSASPEQQATVLAHKTFHRYTTRRKQGGAQSTSDAAKGAAHSAGSSLRRHNEVALTSEIRALLLEWKSLIDQCELIFVRATGNTNRRTLFGPYDGQVLRANDIRNRGFPFTTRRATQSELMRSFVEVTRLKVSHVDEASLAAAAAQESSIPTKAKAPLKPVSKPSPAEEAAMLHTSQLTSLIKRSKVPALLSYIKSSSIDLKSFTFFPAEQYHHTPTPLHFAASLSSAPIISALLVKCGADPTLRSEEGKTAVEVSKDRSARDAFRSARHELGESSWDWDSAGVGSALTPVDAAARDAKEREVADAEAKQELERRKVETERLRQDDRNREESKVEKRIGKGRLLSDMTGSEKREVEGRGMTPEMRARLERERRARAAEERMRRLGGGGN